MGIMGIWIRITWVIFYNPNFQNSEMQKSPLFRVGFFKFKAWRCPTLTWGSPTLPSALFRFTSEFGMESGGSKTLWSPSKFFNSESCFCVLYTFNSVLASSPSKPLGCCMVKPHGQLVSVSSMPHSTYTPDLSTS